MKSKGRLISLAILFFAIACTMSVTAWSHASLAAKIGFFVCGFASGQFAGRAVGKQES
jgi:hypothetical protein